MHEASLMADLMRRVDDIARAENARRVVELSVWLGALSHMSKTHFIEHFVQTAAGGIADGARLDITVSDDAGHPDAQGVIIKSVVVES